MRQALKLRMPVTAILTAVLAAALAGAASARSDAAEPKYRGQVIANYTVTVKDAASAVDARSIVRLNLTTPMRFAYRPDNSY